MGKIIDLTGQRFGRLTVLQKAEKPIGSHSTSTFWKCKCDCGNEKIISSNVLRQGKAQSCGCYNKEIVSSKYIDILGKSFGKLTVLKKVPKPENLKTPGAYWLCKCECGKEKIILGKSLINGSTTSCGACRTNIVDDLTGQSFGKLTVLERDFSRPSNNNGAFWKCRCECGNIVSVLGKNLKHQSHISCGCQRSIGENNIEKLLKDNNIIFQREFSFDDLRGEKGGKLRFDFAIFDDTKNLLRLIEFQGEQHYNDSSIIGWSESPINHDKKKIQYCLKKNIPLVCIPYWKRDTLTLEDIIGNHYLLAEVDA